MDDRIESIQDLRMRNRIPNESRVGSEPRIGGGEAPAAPPEVRPADDLPPATLTLSNRAQTLTGQPGEGFISPEENRVRPQGRDPGGAGAQPELREELGRPPDKRDP